STTGATGSYSLAVDAGYVEVYLQEVAGETYVSTWIWIEITGDTTRDVRALPGVSLSGTVTSGGEPVDTAWINAQTADYYWSGGAGVSPSGTYSLLTPRDVPVTLSVMALPPYLDLDPIEVVLTSDTTMDFTLEIGRLITGRITDSTGATVDYPSVVVRHVKPTTSGGFVEYAYTDGQGGYQAVVPSTLDPPSFVVSVYVTPYARQARGVVATGDAVADFVLSEAFTVSGTVTDGDGYSAYPATVWAYQGSTLVTSARPRTDDGFYEMGLSPGLYTFRVEPWGIYPWEVSSRLAPLEMTDV
ncbi:MAG: hypothetical protein GY713_11860, partial [Actinomycetia bacterium]|nr:hypothetical protein [Actinomycetes bacterium]